MSHPAVMVALDALEDGADHEVLDWALNELEALNVLAGRPCFRPSRRAPLGKKWSRSMAGYGARMWSQSFAESWVLPWSLTSAWGHLL